jgi:hypothetical protein
MPLLEAPKPNWKSSLNPRRRSVAQIYPSEDMWRSQIVVQRAIQKPRGLLHGFLNLPEEPGKFPELGQVFWSQAIWVKVHHLVTDISHFV